MPRIVFDQVAKQFRSARGGTLITALDGLSLAVEDRSFVCLVGPSGCGKSTLLNLLAGFETATRGSVTVDGTDVTEPGPDRGVVFQEAALFPWLTVMGNVCYGPQRLGAKAADYLSRARAMLEQVGLERFADSFPRELSGGMRQRVAIARALVNEPRILLLDEPFGALDAQTRSLMQEMLLNIWEQHQRTVLFVTHDVDEAVFMADRIIVMSRPPGRILADVTVTLPRPRSFEMLTTSEFSAHKRDVLALVRQEARAVAGAAG
jgi:ABC-type nitrate/sulfonate/bicarbonate transport system ATPase subunit